MIAVFLAENIYEMRRQSCSSDEVVHLPAGYTYLVKRDFRLNPEHPPLLKDLCALPLLFLRPRPRVDFSDPNWQQPSVVSQSVFGFRFLYGDPPRADQYLFWGRLPIVLLTACLGFFIFRWAQQLYGNAAGLLALGLYAFSPNVIAHSHFVTTDMGVTAFLTISFYYLWRFLRDTRTRDLCFAGLCMGAAMASKYSAVFLFPVGIFFLWIYSRPSLPLPQERKKDSSKSKGRRSRDRRGRPASFDWNAAIPRGFWRELFHFDRPKLKRVLIFSGLAFVVIQLSFVGSLNPMLYLRGALQVNANHNPFYESFLHGDFKRGGWWNYFLVAFLVKATSPFLLLIFARFIFLFKNLKKEWWSSMFLVVPSIVMFVAVSALADPLGVRYVLPIFPSMMVFSSGILRAVQKRALQGCVWGMLGWHIVSSLLAFPYSLSYFNEFVGGPSKGIYWLDDSNIDWGQELKGVKRYMDLNGIRVITLFSFS
ncbi:MAG: glycosyltransferase family 39 protein, partial [Acidobacteriia bacterium]|nr:glycosyltransferase family 39 protein [Terriglobia bacterium]